MNKPHHIKQFKEKGTCIDCGGVCKSMAKRCLKCANARDREVRAERNAKDKEMRRERRKNK